MAGMAAVAGEAATGSGDARGGDGRGGDGRGGDARDAGGGGGGDADSRTSTLWLSPGWVRSTGATREEVRQDTDGEWYTRAEFSEYYGSGTEWEGTRAASIYKSLKGVT